MYLDRHGLTEAYQVFRIPFSRWAEHVSADLQLNPVSRCRATLSTTLQVETPAILSVEER